MNREAVHHPAKNVVSFPHCDVTNKSSENRLNTQMKIEFTASSISSQSSKSNLYRQKALAEIRNSILPFANETGSSNASSISNTTSGVSSASGLSHGSGSSSPCNFNNKQQCDDNFKSGLLRNVTRGVSSKRDDSSASSSCSDCSSIYPLSKTSKQFSISCNREPPPPPPPPPPVTRLNRGSPAIFARPINPHSLHQMQVLAPRISPSPYQSPYNPLQIPTPQHQQMTPFLHLHNPTVLPQPVTKQVEVAYHQLHCDHQMKPPPPYPIGSTRIPVSSSAQQEKHLTSIIQSQVPLANSIPASSISAKPTPLQTWNARQPRPIMHSVKSKQVQKPVLQTAIAPSAPVITTSIRSSPPSTYHENKITATPTLLPHLFATEVKEPPSYAASVQALATQRSYTTISSVTSGAAVNNAVLETNTTNETEVTKGNVSPIPEDFNKLKSEESKVRNYSPQAFKFYMEQHVENILKSHKERLHRRHQLETEMAKIGLSEEDQFQMRKLLHQKESNYIRLKRAKMDKSMFKKIKSIGVGAFGEVALVRKLDTQRLYAMKTLSKTDVLKRKQVAHVKAERDVLAEAHNEWVVKLYYSFQDQENLYFVMDYIPGGDLMSLLIKKGIFEESLARFYIAELVFAVESVHKMGFIHRDIKPDNILIDQDGHIKLTDFGLCTGFRWTHNSKYYQNGDHSQQESLDETWIQENNRYKDKPLERRWRKEQQRNLAHSLVGTPNYTAPEVLLGKGYTQLCDWWSIGVILYEMLVGRPPFLANTSAETQFKVINWQNFLKIPRIANVSAEAEDLIFQLCTNAENRLGKNSNEVKLHPYFASVDFNEGLRRQPAPYKPTIRNATDTSNFDPIDPDLLRYSDENGDNNRFSERNVNQPEHGFFEFTFRRFFDDAFPGNLVLGELNKENNPGPVYV